jgi:hypothetical protein
MAGMTLFAIRRTDPSSLKPQFPDPNTRDVFGYFHVKLDPPINNVSFEKQWDKVIRTLVIPGP